MKYLALQKSIAKSFLVHPSFSVEKTYAVAVINKHILMKKHDGQPFLGEEIAKKLHPAERVSSVNSPIFSQKFLPKDKQRLVNSVRLTKDWALHQLR